MDRELQQMKQREQGMAIPDLPLDEPQSNHEVALSKFRSAGYEVRWLVVNPCEVGIPQSRPRLHYQGILKKKFPNLNCSVLDEWKRLNNAVDFNHNLADYLRNMDEVPTEIENIHEPCSTPAKRQKVCKWEVTFHEEYRKLKQAHRFFECHLGHLCKSESVVFLMPFGPFLYQIRIGELM